jgi:predicted unusual protein kinase regulating ubiquinone biosynthesis (AarF/ABC1/UbiB family)
MRAPKRSLAIYLKELEQRISNECDFGLEAESMLRIGKRFANDPYISIPRVHKELSSPTLLVTELMRGKTLSQTMECSQSERDHWGLNLVRFVVSSCRDNDFNTDPHPGNFLFQDDKVVCLDFGSTCQMPSSFSGAWNLMILSCVRNDISIYRTALERAGMRQGVSQKEIERGFQDLIYRVPGCWTYPGKQPLSAKVITEQIKALSGTGRGKGNVPPEFIFGLRVYFGHLSLVSAFGAEADWNDLVAQIMSNECQKYFAQKS